MIVLNGSSESLEMTQSAATAVRYHVSWTDFTSADDKGTPGKSEGSISTATTSTIVAAPSGTTKRVIQTVGISLSGGTNNITMQIDVGGTNYVVFSQSSISVNQALTYNSAEGWKYEDKQANGNSVLANPSSSSGRWTDHSFVTIAGDGISNPSAGVLAADTEDEQHIIIDSEKIAFRKSPNRHFWYEDFDNCPSIDVSTTALVTTNVPLGTTNWLAKASGSTGLLRLQYGTNNHPGVLRVETGAGTNDSCWLYRGSTNESLGVLPYRGQDCYIQNTICALSSASNSSFVLGLGDASSGGDEYIVFIFSSGTSANVRCLTRTGGTSTTTDSGVAPGTGFNKYTIFQSSLQNVEFYIDDVLVATHTTNVPNTTHVGPFIVCTTLTNSSRYLDVDYYDFETNNLGARTS